MTNTQATTNAYGASYRKDAKTALLCLTCFRAHEDKGCKFKGYMVFDNNERMYHKMSLITERLANQLNLPKKDVVYL